MSRMHHKYYPIEFPDGFKLIVCKNTYPPDEDSYLMLDALNKLELSSDIIGLDMGCGSGILTCFLAKRIKYVFSIDINPYALNCTLNNLILNKLMDRATVFYSNLFSSIPHNLKFNLIVFNPPYLPTDEYMRSNIYLDLYSIGGKKGVGITLKFLDEAIKYMPIDGKILLLVSSLEDEQKINKKIVKLGLKSKIISEKKLFFEKLKVLLISFDNLSK
ncbi:MAG: HemK2/MTQ2 family protein methyltransferase [Candidatus Asgardarchaeia archaeon]